MICRKTTMIMEITQTCPEKIMTKTLMRNTTIRKKAMATIQPADRPYTRIALNHALLGLPDLPDRKDVGATRAAPAPKEISVTPAPRVTLDPWGQKAREDPEALREKKATREIPAVRVW